MIRMLGVIILLALLTLSCEENISPFGAYNEKYTLNCILRGDSTIQYATVTKSFYNLNPTADNSEKRFLENVDLRIWQGNDVYRFRDSIISTMLYGKEVSLNIYYTKGFIPKYNDEIEIEALLSNGKRLSSSTIIPKSIYIQKSVSDTSIPSKDNRQVFVKWESAGENLIYAPEINIYYKKKGFEKGFAKRVPIEYVKQSGKYYPNYAKPSKDNFVSIAMDAIRRAMEEISEDDPVKKNYTILTMIVHIHVYDKNLSEYYVSSAQNLDQFSVNVDALDYTNIKGGFGIFGSYNSKKYVIKFNREFIGAFGYNVGVEE